MSANAKEEAIQKGRDDLAAIQAYLVNTVDLVALSKCKLPAKAQVVRESLLWRAEELARNAFETLDSDRFVASAIGARAVMETTAALVLLDTLISRGIEQGVTAKLVREIDRFLIGSKVWSEMDDPIHVNDMLREVEKVVPGFFETHYAGLSEMAHPNWSGAFGAFGEFDQENLIATFKTGGRSPEMQRVKIGANLAGSLGLAKGYHEMIGGRLAAFAEATEKFYAGNPSMDATE